MNAKHTATRILDLFAPYHAAAGVETCSAYIYGHYGYGEGDFVVIERAKAPKRRRPRRIAKKVEQRHGYAHHVHGHADLIQIGTAGMPMYYEERILVDTKGCSDVGEQSSGADWPEALREAVRVAAGWA